MADAIDMSTFGDGGDIDDSGDDDIFNTNADDIIDVGQITGPSTSTDTHIKYDTRLQRLKAKTLKNEISALFDKLKTLFPEQGYITPAVDDFERKNGKLYYISGEYNKHGIKEEVALSGKKGTLFSERTIEKLITKSGIEKLGFDYDFRVDIPSDR